MSASKKISIFGVTGSIGQSTVDLILAQPDDYEVIAVSADKNYEKLAQLAHQLKAQYAVLRDTSYVPALENLLEGSNITVLSGKEGLKKAAQIPVDTVVSAIVGLAGLEVTYTAIPYCKKLALANKESIVAAGENILSLAANHGTALLPVDSEHSAIFQVFEPSHRSTLHQIILTASGGPFRQLPLTDFPQITVEKALKHPNWDMGAKITIDCATLANKGLELIEAAILFQVPSSQIDVVIHPQSIIHSLVSYQDGSTLAQLGTPDMRTAISYALEWPQRKKTSVRPLNLVEIGHLTFEAPDEIRFPALKLARQALEAGQASRLIFNTANEVAVDAFIKKQISFQAISQVIEKTLEIPSPALLETVDHILNFDQQLRTKTLEIIKQYKN